MSPFATSTGAGLESCALPTCTGRRNGLMQRAAQHDLSPPPRVGINPKICGGRGKSNISIILSENQLQPV